jgi:hypothetical protein
VGGGGGMIKVNSEAQLKQMMIAVLDDVMEEILSKLLDKLIANIDEIVYVGKNEVYVSPNAQPTYQFRDSWTTLQTKDANEIKGRLYQEPLSMDFDPDRYIHGSWLGDAREMLASYLFLGTDSSVFGHGWWEEPRDAWTPTMKLLEDGTVDKWFVSACKKRGLQIKKTMSFSDWKTKYSK